MLQPLCDENIRQYNFKYSIVRIRSILVDDMIHMCSMSLEKSLFCVELNINYLFEYIDRVNSSFETSIAIKTGVLPLLVIFT